MKKMYIVLCIISLMTFNSQNTFAQENTVELLNEFANLLSAPKTYNQETTITQKDVIGIWVDRKPNAPIVDNKIFYQSICLSHSEICEYSLTEITLDRTVVMSLKGKWELKDGKLHIYPNPDEYSQSHLGPNDDLKRFESPQVKKNNKERVLELMKSLNGVQVKSIVSEGSFRVLTITFTLQHDKTPIDFKLYSQD